MTMPVDLFELRAEIAKQLEGAIRPATIQCNAQLPHDTIVFQRGPNMYLCRCGMKYEKDGRGGLREVG